MKVIAALALLSVALASPVALPAPVVLPEPAQPAIETSPYVAIAEPIDISPLFVPQEVVEALKLAEFNPEAVIFVDVAENIEHEPVVSSPAIKEELPSFGVNFVEVAEGLDFSEDTAAHVEEVAADAVRFVDNAEEIPADAVRFSDFAAENQAVAEEAAAFAEDIGSQVRIVEVAENVDFEESALRAAEISADAVRFVDFAEDQAVAEEIGSQVHIVDVAENVDFEESILRVAEVLAEAIRFVEVAENMDVAEESAVLAEEIPADAVKVVDFAENVESAPVADTVQVVDAPLRYPAKLYDNPMLR